jgi:hypothetical protein
MEFHGISFLMASQSLISTEFPQFLFLVISAETFLPLSLTQVFLLQQMFTEQNHKIMHYKIMGFIGIFSYMYKIHFAPIDPSLLVLLDPISLPRLVSLSLCHHFFIFMPLDYTYESKHARLVFLGLV